MPKSKHRFAKEANRTTERKFKSERRGDGFQKEMSTSPRKMSIGDRRPEIEDASNSTVGTMPEKATGALKEEKRHSTKRKSRKRPPPRSHSKAESPGHKSKSPGGSNGKKQKTSEPNHPLEGREPMKDPFPLYNDTIVNGNQSRKRKGGKPSSATTETIGRPGSKFDRGFSSVATMLLGSGKKNILVLVGAGMSVSCGIPDFRSRGTGLYETLDAQSIGLNGPEDLFDIHFFSQNPRPFYEFAKSYFYAETPPSPSSCHYFLAELERRNMLLRVYTQNIDGLEKVAGVSPNKIVHAHGHFGEAVCLDCGKKVKIEEVMGDISKGLVPKCQKRRKQKVKKNDKDSKIGAAVSDDGRGNGRSGNRRKRAMSEKAILNVLANAGDPKGGGDVCGGVMKPGVTFFGERIEDRVTRTLEADHSKADALIVIGTSLSVAPMSSVIKYLPQSIPRVLINRTSVTPPVSNNNKIMKKNKHKPEKAEPIPNDNQNDNNIRNGYTFDASLLGNCDDIVQALTDQANWKHDNKCTRDSLNVRGQVYDEDERVFLFPGALLPGGDDDESVDVLESVNCDGCGEEIAADGIVMKCVECFNYDLCDACYKKGKGGRLHFGGAHKFVKDR